MLTAPRLDRVGPLPLYQQLGGWLREEIRSGHFAPGVALPSERKLMARFEVTRDTVRSALGLLRAEGLVSAEQGAGAFVRELAGALRILEPEPVTPGRMATGPSDARAFRIPSAETVTIVRTKADPVLAGYLGVAPGTALLQRQVLRTEEDAAVEWCVQSYPAALVRGSPIATPDPGPGGVKARLAELGHAIDGWEDWIAARMPTPEERSRLQILEGVPVLELTRVAAAHGQVMEVTVQVAPADRTVLHYDRPS